MEAQYTAKLAADKNKNISKEGQIDLKFKEAQKKKIEELEKAQRFNK